MAAKSPLRSFLASPEGVDLVTFDEVRGFIFAVAGTPELVPPSEWLPEAFNGEMPEFQNTKQAQAVLEELMDVYNSAIGGGRQLKSQAPAFRRDTISNLDEDAAIGCWSRGFIRGHSWLQDVWDESTPDELDEELGAILLVLSFFASRRMAEAYLEETGDGKSLEDLAEIVRRTFKDAMVEYVRLGQSIYQVRLEYERASAEAGAKVGRNEPCPCGSGRKYKRCCGAGSSD